MAMNPMKLMKLKERWTIFRKQHPKVVAFLSTTSRNGSIAEGSVIELRITNPSGKTSATNMRVSAEDAETLKILTDLKK